MMNMNVILQFAAFCISFVTNITNEWFLTTMNYKMLLVIVFATESSATNFTIEWFFARMHPNMTFQVTLCSKYFVTDGAQMSVTIVHFDVSIKSNLILKQLFAQAALKDLLTSVYNRMLVEFCFHREKFMTVRTLMNLFTSM